MLDELGEVGEVVLPPAAAARQEVSSSLALGLVRYWKCVIAMFVHSGTVGHTVLPRVTRRCINFSCSSPLIKRNKIFETFRVHGKQL